MQRVLVLAYYFPPLGGAGVQRTAKLVKFLGEAGYRATVVTGHAEEEVDWAPADTSLCEDIPAQVETFRASRRPNTTKRNARLRRWLGISSEFDTWWREESVRLGRAAIADADVIYASMSPFSTAKAASDLARESGRPWVADLRDPWALDEWAVYPTAFHRALDRRRMRRALRGAAAVVMNTDEAARTLVEEFPELRDSDVEAIPNGWDAEDFAGPPPNRTDDAFRIVYTGYSHILGGARRGARGRFLGLLGGTTPGLDVTARSHARLVEALRILDRSDPGLAGRVELHLAGPAAHTRSSTLSIDARVTDHGYLAHADAVALMRSADALFLPMHDLPPGVRARTVPGKTYEFLASGRPILAALPDGDARDLLEGLPNVWLCRPNDVAAMATALSEIARVPLPPPPAREFLERFERGALARRVAAVLTRAARLSSDR